MAKTSMKTDLRGVYLITDHGENLVERVSAAIDSVCAVQLRSKSHSDDERLRIGRQLRQLCLEKGKLFIVNDDVELALALDADGVHLGQEDGDPLRAREILGADKLIGISTHTAEEALQAASQGADYIGFGAMFHTGSKDVQYLPGPELLADIRKIVDLPIVAIGGIDRNNAATVIDAGADAIAVISAVMSHKEPSVAASELKLLFNRKQRLPRGSVLTVAGSDSGGGAGIQADLKVITLLGAYGSSVITALTAQNTCGVTAIHPAPPQFVAAQLDAVLSDIPVDVVKTGMLFSAGIIEVVADKLKQYDKRLLLVDPVMIAKGGARLIDEAAIDTLVKSLLPLTYLLTPNIPEAQALTGMAINSEAQMLAAAEKLHLMGARNILLKGGHMDGDEAADLLYEGTGASWFRTPRITSSNTHGTGCSTASAIAAFLSMGEPLPMAVAKAKEFITAAIRLAQPLGKGHSPVNHILAAAVNQLSSSVVE